MTSARALTSLLCVCACLPLPIQAQGTQPGPRDVYFVEQRTDDRWLHSKQLHLFTPFRQTRTFTQLTPATGGLAGQMVLRAGFALRQRPWGPDSVRFTLASDGTFLGAVALHRPPSITPPQTSADSLLRLDQMNFMSLPTRWFIMPAARVWDIVPVVRAVRLQRGARWVDTLALSTRAGEHSQSLSGVRTSVVVGDTTVDGRQLWKISDSTDAFMTETFLEEERSLAGYATIVRSVRGPIRSHYLYDPALRLFLSRVDTAALKGTTTLHYPDHRSFVTPVRFDRYRRSLLHTVQSHSERLAALRIAPEVEDDRGPNAGASELQRRVIAGEPRLIDSLVAVYERSQDPIERQKIGTPSAATGGAVALHARLNEIALRAGDTAILLALRPRNPREWSVPLVRDLLIPKMADPAAALALGVQRDLFYTMFLNAMIQNLPAFITDTAAWGLSPAVMVFLAEQGRTASEPRLRDLGLVALFARNPRRWADSVAVRARAGSAIVEEAGMLAAGVGRADPRMPKVPMPDSSADWRTWIQWAVPQTGASFAPPVAPLISRAFSTGRGGSGIPFAEPQARTVRVYEAVTGRPIVAELQRKLAAAPDDSSRLLFSAMMRVLGETPLDLNQLEVQFRSGEASQIATARARLREVFVITPDQRAGLRPRPPGPQPAPVDSATSEEIADRLISIALGAGPVWAALEQRVSGALSAPPMVESQRGLLNTVIISDSIPAGAIARWRQRATLLSQTEWARRSDADLRRSYAISGMVRTGQFINVRLSWSERLPPNPGGMQGHGGFTNFFLMRMDNEWVVVLSERAAS